ncbi:MAG TPA: aldehyde dehydrogenase family protein [Steroidobacteraceae bacterium]
MTHLKETLAGRPRQLLIGGKWRPALAGGMLDVFDPANGEVFAQAAAGEAADIDAAVKAARYALEQSAWRTTSPAERARLLWKLSDAIEANAAELALLETLDNGMPLWVAQMWNIPKAVECLRYYSGWPMRLTGETLPVSSPGEYHTYTRKEPIGVVGQIVAWNMPFGMAVGKIAPALAAGCTVVLKPAEQTPLSAVRLGELIQEVGFPEGVVNIVTGTGESAGKPLVEHPDVDKIAFTGSTRVGKSILSAAGSTLKRVTLELGGKSPVFIFPDAQLEGAIAAAANGIFFNTGQICAAGSRLFVHERVYDKVMEGVLERARTLKIGPGSAPDTFMGPVVSAQQLERVNSYVRSGQQQGAEVIVGEQKLPSRGYFVRPTVLSNVRPDMTVMREEIFGPVVCAARFGDDDMDAIARVANDTSYGLSAYIWTSNLSVAHKLAARIKAGSISVNGGAGMDFTMPFGGFKQSGLGREHGREGVEAYTETKTISITL